MISSANPFRAPHISILDFSDGLPAALASELKAKDIFVTVRGSKVRISPHVYNDEEDILALFDCLAAQLEKSLARFSENLGDEPA